MCDTPIEPDNSKKALSLGEAGGSSSSSSRAGEALLLQAAWARLGASLLGAMGASRRARRSEQKGDAAHWPGVHSSSIGRRDPRCVDPVRVEAEQSAGGRPEATSQPQMHWANRSDPSLLRKKRKRSKLRNSLIDIMSCL